MDRTTVDEVSQASGDIWERQGTHPMIMPMPPTGVRGPSHRYLREEVWRTVIQPALLGKTPRAWERTHFFSRSRTCSKNDHTRRKGRVVRTDSFMPALGRRSEIVVSDDVPGQRWSKRRQPFLQQSWVQPKRVVRIELFPVLTRYDLCVSAEGRRLTAGPNEQTYGALRWLAEQLH